MTPSKARFGRGDVGLVPPIGGIARHEGSTRRRHAARRLRVVQNPHHHLHGEHQGYGGPGRSACERQKPGNRTQGRPHFRYKTLPAHPPSPHVRYKTLPARPKWLNLALFLHAGRVLYRSHHQEAEQGEFCTEREAETGLANTTAHQAPPVWRAAAGPGPDKFRMQFKNTSDTASQTDTN